MNFTAIDPRQIGIVAAKEFRERIRNRWVLAVTLVFAVFAMVIAYFGAAQQGALGFDAIVGERERGSLDLLLSMPLTRFELLLGKFLGLAAALACSTIAGFGVVGLVLGAKLPPQAWFHYAGFIVSSVLLGMAFLSLAVMVSVFASDRARASGGAIALWFFFVLVYDLLLLGALVVSGGAVAADAFPYLLLLNPADVFRILNIFGLEDVRTLYGLTTVFPGRLANPVLLGAVMLAWIALPLGLATWRFRK
jgi:Cu-processing system permease protein